MWEVEMPVTAVSLFSGCGGFDLGARRAGVDILWANDINQHAAATYRKYLPDVTFVHGDITALDKRCLPRADLLIGCYPCQGFSAGARRRYRGREVRDYFANEGNFLYQQFVEAIPYVRPAVVFIENVKGLRSSVNGWFFNAQKEALERAGYVVYAERLNAKDYGLPQSRERIFIVGIRQDVGFEYVFPSPTHGPGLPHPHRSQFEVIGHLPHWPIGEFEAEAFHGHYLTRNRKRPWDSYSYTIVANSGHVPLHPLGEPMQRVGTDAWILCGDENRRLSWRECGLLQSFGEDFEPEGPLSAKYTLIGNAVPPMLAQQIVQPVVAFFEGNASAGRKALGQRKATEVEYNRYLADFVPGDYGEVVLNEGEKRLTIQKRLKAAASRHDPPLTLAFQRTRGNVLRFHIKVATSVPATNGTAAVVPEAHASNGCTVPRGVASTEEAWLTDGTEEQQGDGE
jgi:DNA (cytosine-5)-methyltransferase 1